MRSTRGRIAHALAFEAVGLVLVAPLGAWAFGLTLHDSGAVALGSSVIATGWTFLYNLLADRALMRLRGHTAKSLGDRIVHAVLYEAGLVAILAPLIAWYLGIGLVAALVMDLAFAAAWAVYAFAFNWAWDGLFPPPAPSLPVRD